MSDALYVLSTFLPLIIVWLIPSVICGELSSKLAARKGYSGYFWTGFLLGVMGLIYVAGLPDNRN